MKNYKKAVLHMLFLIIMQKSKFIPMVILPLEERLTMYNFIILSHFLIKIRITTTIIYF